MKKQNKLRKGVVKAVGKIKTRGYVSEKEKAHTT